MRAALVELASGAAAAEADEAAGEVEVASGGGSALAFRRRQYSASISLTAGGYLRFMAKKIRTSSILVLSLFRKAVWMSSADLKMRSGPAAEA